MKKAFVLLVLTISTLTFAQGSHRVRTYTRKNGTTVQAHRQTNPDKTQRNNWSSKPNVNPYTGKRGTKTPKK